MGRTRSLSGTSYTLLDFDELTGAEVCKLQVLSGIRGTKHLLRAVVDEDMEVVIGMTYLSMLREDPDVEYDVIAEHPFVDFLDLADTMEGDADPPTQIPEAGGASGSDITLTSPPVTSAT